MPSSTTLRTLLSLSFATCMLSAGIYLKWNLAHQEHQSTSHKAPHKKKKHIHNKQKHVPPRKKPPPPPEQTKHSPSPPPPIYSLTPSSSSNLDRILTPEIQQAYEQDGVVAIRGLLPPEFLERLDEASSVLVRKKQADRHKRGVYAGAGGGSQFHTVEVDVYRLDPPVLIPNDNNQDTDHVTVKCQTDKSKPCPIETDAERILAEQSRAKSNSNHNSKEEEPSIDHNPGPLSAFRNVAMDSLVPVVAAQLLKLDQNLQMQNNAQNSNSTHGTNDNGEYQGTATTNTTRNLRLLRDVFLAKDEDAYICGWHVDDWGFWPSQANSDGINAWLALDDMPLTHPDFYSQNEEIGGGFALAVGSHTASWREEAYQATGATPTYPHAGFADASEMVSQRVGGGTCNIATHAPHLHQEMERTKRIYEVKKGDVLFFSRWLFHRTVPFHREYVRRYFQSLTHGPPQEEHVGTGMPPLLYRRYSMRYVPGDTARLPVGYTLEPSVLYEENHGNRTLDEVAMYDETPWYPQVWSAKGAGGGGGGKRYHGKKKWTVAEVEAWQELVQKKLPVAMERQKERKKEMQPYLQDYGRKIKKQRDRQRQQQHSEL